MIVLFIVDQVTTSKQPQIEKKVVTVTAPLAESEEGLYVSPLSIDEKVHTTHPKYIYLVLQQQLYIPAVGRHSS